MNVKQVSILGLIFCLMAVTFAASAFSCKLKADGKSLDLSKFKDKIIEGTPSGGALQKYFLSLCGDLPAANCPSDGFSLCTTSGFGPQGWASNSEEPEPTATYVPAVDEVPQGFFVTYKNAPCDNSSERTTTLKLLCDEKADEQFTVNILGSCELEAIYHNPAFCGSSGSSGGLSGGAIFLIVLFSVAAAYFIGGFLLCKFYFKKQGCKESIPQGAFWCALPGLFVTGIKCTFDFFRTKCCGGKSSSSGEYESYGSVEEP